MSRLLPFNLTVSSYSYYISIVVYQTKIGKGEIDGYIFGIMHPTAETIEKWVVQELSQISSPKALKVPKAKYGPKNFYQSEPGFQLTCT